VVVGRSARRLQRMTARLTWMTMRAIERGREE
jgi:hypothetical protein